MNNKMTTNPQLSTTQIQYFQQISEVTFCNPFSAAAIQLEHNIANIPAGSITDEQLYERIISSLQKQFENISNRGEFNFQQYPDAEQKLLEVSWLYYCYRIHQYDFDHFIETQNQAGDKPVKLPFAHILSNSLEQGGFDSAQCEKYIALFFQLRRAYYFISRNVSGLSASMINLRIQLWQNLFTFQSQWYLDFLCSHMEDFSTLLLGATGTGKSTVAQAIGCSGFIPFDLNSSQFKASFTRAFQAINLSQFPATLLESELFGHKKGAFTGAIDNHQGIFSRCSQYGAVFIDEIGEIDIPTQVKLLTVIQQRTFTPLGDHQQQRFEGRVIAATNKDITKLRHSGQFRNDLYYRLCSDVIHIPGLQQRLYECPDELALLTNTILQKMLPNTTSSLSHEVHQLITKNLPKNYSWPGNVRELEQCIRQICLSGHYQAEVTAAGNSYDTTNMHNQQHISAQQLIQEYCLNLYRQYENYESVARITQLDRRTVKKHILAAADGDKASKH